MEFPTFCFNKTVTILKKNAVFPNIHKLFAFLGGVESDLQQLSAENAQVRLSIFSLALGKVENVDPLAIILS